MSPDDDAGKPKGKTVMEVLQSKHPEQATPGEEAFVECSNLPDLFLLTSRAHTFKELQTNYQVVLDRVAFNLPNFKNYF